MTAQLPETWTDLRDTSRPIVGGYRLALLHSGANVRVFAAIQTGSGLPGVLLDLPTDAPGIESCPLLCKAFNVTVAPFPGMAPYRVGVLTMLGNPEYEDLFGLLAQEILDATKSAKDPGQAVAAAKRVVERWRYFTERRRAPMTDERVRGLIGELLVLARLLRSGEATAILRAWTGPSDGLHDFEMPSWSGEVKTFLADEGPTVRISDPRQLEVVELRPVYLIPVKLARSSTAGKALPSIIDIVSEQLHMTPGALDLFDLKLAAYGYLPAHSALYTDPYACEQILTFAVRHGFPRIAFEDIPSAVMNVQYSLSLGALGSFALSTESLLGSRITALEPNAP